MWDFFWRTMRRPLILRFMIAGLALLITIVFVPMAASFVVRLIQSIGGGIISLFDPIFQSGEARLEGIIRLCLYFIIITFLVRFMFGSNR